VDKLPHQLGQLLLRRKAITETQLQEALSLQAEQPQPLGQALIALGYLDDRTLARTLRQQRWLRPCAACFAFMSPFSVCVAEPAETDSDFSAQWLEEANWHYVVDSEQASARNSADLLKLVAMTAWDVYQGEPEAGEMRYAVSQSGDNGYQLEMTLHF
tara:strand:- start:104 stop:577 length:474 start_codon:yes stop_codon:yes gene_type:complete